MIHRIRVRRFHDARPRRRRERDVDREKLRLTDAEKRHVFFWSGVVVVVVVRETRAQNNAKRLVLVRRCSLFVSMKIVKKMKEEKGDTKEK